MVNPVQVAGIVGAGAAAAYVGVKAFTNSNDPNSIANARAQFGNYTFPEDLVSPDIGRNFYIDIQFQRYQRRSIFQQPILQATGGIQLPIPNNLRDQMNANWSEAKGGAVGAGIEQFLKESNNDTATQGIGGLNLDTAGKFSKAAVSGLQSASITATSNLLNSLDASTAAQTTQTFGLAQNPFMTMLYNGPTYKSHTFEWTLAPRNPSETETLKSIILALKSNMLPSMSDSAGILLTYPNMAIVTIYPTGYLYDFKMCVVKDLSINFAPSGPSFFRNSSAPTQVILSVTLQEIEYFLKEDIIDNSARGNPGATSDAGPARSQVRPYGPPADIPDGAVYGPGGLSG